MNAPDFVRLARLALLEDLADGPDVTTESTISADDVSTARLVSREPGIIAGLDAITATFTALREPDIAAVAGCAAAPTVELLLADGSASAPGDTLATVTAPTRALLVAERTMLNILSHASGIATATRAWVDAVEGTGARIRDTRKTLPGLRDVQKYAVRIGGGTNHRMGLGDAALIKDNHIAVAGIVDALAAVREHSPRVSCEVEVDTLDQLQLLLDLPAPPELVLLDNFSVADTAEAVRRRDGLHRSGGARVELESSGGLSLDVARAYALAGVDYLAVGALTHSVSALDIGLDY